MTRLFSRAPPNGAPAIFCQRGASLGPRAAATFYVIFHWNRAGLYPTEQALLAESLSERILDDVRG